jgi:hypothetical protein
MHVNREPSNQSFEIDREATVCFASRRFFLLVSCEREVKALLQTVMPLIALRSLPKADVTSA